jgi:hypothetical protein
VDFDSLAKLSDRLVFATVGEIVTVQRQSTGLVIEDIDVVIDEDVEVVLDDVSVVTTTVSYQLEDVGQPLCKGDQVRRSNGDILVLEQRLMKDASTEVRLAGKGD